MTTEEKNTIKHKLENDIYLLKKQIESLKEKTMPIAPDCSLGRLTRLEAMQEPQVNKSVLEASATRLVRLQNALLHIEKPMFGICIECEEEIDIERMKIKPESIRCVKCAHKKGF